MAKLIKIIQKMLIFRLFFLFPLPPPIFFIFIHALYYWITAFYRNYSSPWTRAMSSVAVQSKYLRQNLKNLICDMCTLLAISVGLCRAPLPDAKCGSSSFRSATAWGLPQTLRWVFCGIDAAASLYCVFPLESSDINKHHWQVLHSRISFAI